VFGLLIKVCVGAAFCQFIAPPVSYDSEGSCRMQAGFIAGMVAANYRPGEPVVMVYQCLGDDGVEAQAPWTEVTLLAPAAG